MWGRLKDEEEREIMETCHEILRKGRKLCIADKNNNIKDWELAH